MSLAQQFIPLEAANENLVSAVLTGSIKHNIRDFKARDAISGIISAVDEISSIIQDIPQLLSSVTWAELTALQSTSALVAGTSYRITDYVTTVDQTDCQSAGHPFDLIITAIDSCTLDEHATATLPSNGDTYFDARPFHVPDYQQYLEYARVPLESWDIKYCLDNDKTRFKFADQTNGKGVIYYMKDEFGNEAPYDFKNVQFKRYKITSSPGATGLEGMYGLVVGGIEVDTSDEIWCYTFNGADYADFGFSEPYDFSGWHMRPTQAVLQQFGGPSIERLQECAGNVIQARQEDNSDYSLMSFKLPNNVFHCALTLAPVSELPFLKIGYCNGNKLGLNCFDNTFGGNCYRNTFGDSCYSNTFGDSCYSNTFGGNCYRNTFGGNCYSNTFGDSCYSNTFGGNCDSNTFGNGCYSNIFGQYCISNAFSNKCGNNTFSNNCGGNIFGNECKNIIFNNNYCSYNKFGNYCYSNEFDTNSYYNIFGNQCNFNKFSSYCSNNFFASGCRNNVFGSNCSNNTFGNSCQYIIFGSSASVTPATAKSYCKNINISSSNQKIILNSTGSTTILNCYQNIDIKSGVNNTSTWKTITDNNVGQTFTTTYQPMNSQVIAV